MAFRGAESAETSGTSPCPQVPWILKPSGHFLTTMRSSHRTLAWPFSILTTVDLPASEWPTNKQSPAVEDKAAGMDEAGLPVRQDPAQRELIRREQRKGQEAPLSEGIRVIGVGPGPCMIIVEYGDHSVADGLVGRSDPDIDPGILFPVDRPRGLSMHFFSEVPAVELGDEEVMADTDDIIPRPLDLEMLEFGMEGRVRDGQIGIDPDREAGNLIIATVGRLEGLPRSSLFFGQVAEMIHFDRISSVFQIGVGRAPRTIFPELARTAALQIFPPAPDLLSTGRG